MRKSRWTPDEERRADELRALEVSYTAIDGILGKGRGTTRSFCRRKQETPDARARRLSAMRRWHSSHERIPPAGGGRDVPYVPPIEKHVPPYVLAERALAIAHPRSLGAVLMGDPPLNRSALGRRVHRAPTISLAPVRCLMSAEVSS